jgi:type IV secretory pathway ATPase VirB11/archaellum biosynthesis ATPase
MARPRTVPFHWWGPPWADGMPRSLDDLVSLGSLTGAAAEFLISHVRQGGSVVVAAMPQGAGKSTFAFALGEAVHPDRTRIYLRGAFESFDWVDQFPAATTTLLVNEISNHLPVYCWDRCARRLLELAAGGYQVIATAHASTTEQFVRLLSESPMAATASEVVAFDVVVFLDIQATPTGIERQLESVYRWQLDPHSGLSVARPVPLDV